MASDRQYARRSGLISVDRPGIGRSDPQPGRTIGDWAGEVAGLLDLIEVERFAVLGWSRVASTRRRWVMRCPIG